MLPVDAVLPQLLDVLSERNCALLVAPPGGGKTTRAPPALLDAPWAKSGKIILLAPRRIAARAAASRMAAERGERVGETIGYRVRLDSKISKATRIEVVTEGVFTRMILDDPELAGAACVILDEFHERSLEGDLALALARDAQAALRPDLRILVMSATLDAARVSALLDDAPVVVSEGRMFPVDTRWRPRAPHARIEDEMASAAAFALSQDEGDVLAFLPGAGEIERTASLLREKLNDPRVDVWPLYGALSGVDQDAAIAPSPEGRRKIVLATSIAETSLTIEGVRIVIDSGLTRRPRYEPALGLARLETVRASQAAIEQRRGRAGRTAPGVCWRLWAEAETRSLPAFDRPEMLDADLANLALDLAAWGVSDPASLCWLDPPPKAAWAQARGLLTRLGALDAQGQLTDHGRALSKLPLPPRLAHMVLACADDEALTAAELAILLTEQGLGGRGADLEARVQKLRRDRDKRSIAARALAERIARLAGKPAVRDAQAPAGPLLARAFPDRVAKARGGGGFVMANGRAASVEIADPLAREAFLVIADAGGAADRARIFSASPITQAEIEALFGDEIETRNETWIEKETGAARARRVRAFGRLVLSEGPAQAVSKQDLQSALIDMAREEGLAALPMHDAAQTRARVALMRALEGESWPDWSDEALMADLEAWLPAALGQARSLKDADVNAALLNALPWDLRRKLDAEAPLRFATPAGGAAPIDYAADGGPFLDVRLQEMFGLGVHPSIAGGRMALAVRLLSPAGRPLQTTRDLPGFWRGSYAGVRADMRGRYPKHPWPEDPINAEPTRRAKPRP